MWTKIDDGFYDNPKVTAAGNAAAGVYVRALAWCGRQLTDGFITDTQALILAGPDGQLVLDRLVAVKLWQAVEGGYRIPDYLEFNPSAAEVKAKRQKATARVADWRAKKEAERTPGGNAVTNSVGNAVGNAAPDPTRPEKKEGGQRAGAREAPAPTPEQGVRGTDPTPAVDEYGSLDDDAEPVRLPTVEHLGAVTGDAAADALARGSGGTLRTMGAGGLMARLGELARTAKPSPLTLADFELVGRAYAAGAVFAWCQRVPDLGMLTRDEGQHLFAAVQEARAWQAKQRPANVVPFPRPAAPPPSQDPPRQVLSQAEITRAAAETMAKLRGRPTGSES